MENAIHNKRGFFSVVAILLGLGVIIVGCGAYFLLRSNEPVKQSLNNFIISEQSQNITTSAENEKLDENLVLELELSSLSQPKGVAEIYWTATANGIGNFVGGFVSGHYYELTTTPLDLVSGMKITNNTNKSILLSGINNENFSGSIYNSEFLTDTTGGPIILLPEKFIKNEKEEILCNGRNLFSETINNICTFATPLVIAPKETLNLWPQLFAVPSKIWEQQPYTREKTTFINSKDSKDSVYVTIKNGGQYLFLSNIFLEYDQVSQNQTFHLGGLIFVNAKDNNFINNIFDFKISNGQKIDADIKLTPGLIVKLFELPKKEFETEKNKFSDNILGMQVFLYKNNFMSKEDIGGVYDDKTVTAIKRLQKSAYIVETGRLDDATVFVSKGFDTGIYFYENYGDEEVTVSLDSNQPYFRLFGIGTEAVNIKKDFSNSSLISKVGATDAHTLDGRKIFTLGGITILNNTPETKQCTLTNSNNVQIKNFQIAPNEMYSQRTTVGGISAPAIHRLQCGDKSLDIELSPLIERG